MYMKYKLKYFITYFINNLLYVLKLLISYKINKYSYTEYFNLRPPTAPDISH